MFVETYGPVVLDPGMSDLLPTASEIGPAPTLQQIKTLQDLVGAQPQMEVPVQHFFSPGQYTRACFIQAGGPVVGKMHRHQHPAMLLHGVAVINTDRGMERIAAPFVWVSQPSAKRAVHALTDCVFATVHLNPTDTTDVSALEAELIVPESSIDYESPQEAAYLSNAVQGAYA